MIFIDLQLAIYKCEIQNHLSVFHYSGPVGSSLVAVYSVLGTLTLMLVDSLLICYPNPVIIILELLSNYYSKIADA